MQNDLQFIRRCHDIARRGVSFVSPNPAVGAVLVYKGQIIGEGFHSAYGKAHAEVEAIANVGKEEEHLICKSSLYVSLEPCSIYGKTPPCVDLILKHRIPRVVISCLDNTPGVNGRGVEILKNAGIEVLTNVLKEEGLRLSAPRQTFVSKKRPYIILKYAQSTDGYLGRENQQLWLSHPLFKRLTHKWRSESGAILIGTNTAQTDDPLLTNRLYFGPSPFRLVLDRKKRLPENLNIFNGDTETWCYTEKTTGKKMEFYRSIAFNENLLNNILKDLYAHNINSLLVEGGAKLLASFIQQNLWDEARVYTAAVCLGDGIKAPSLNEKPDGKWQIDDTLLHRYYNASQPL